MPSIAPGKDLDGRGSCPLAKTFRHIWVELEFRANEHRDAMQHEHGARVRARHDQYGRSKAQGEGEIGLSHWGISGISSHTTDALSTTQKLRLVLFSVQSKILGRTQLFSNAP